MPIALATLVEKTREGLKRHEFRLDPGTSHAPQLNIGPRDNAGQAETANGGAEHLWIFFAAADDQAVVRAMQAKLLDMIAKRSGTMVILAMNIIGDGAPYRHELRAGRYRKKPSLGKEYVDDIGETDAAFAAQHAR